MQVPFSIAIANVELFMSVFPNALAWEHKAWNKIKKHEKGKKRGMSTKRSKAGTKKSSADGLNIA